MVFLEFVKVPITKSKEEQKGFSLKKCNNQIGGEKILINYYDIISFEENKHHKCTIITLRNGNVYAVKENYYDLTRILNDITHTEIG